MDGDGESVPGGVVAEGRQQIVDAFCFALQHQCALQLSVTFQN